MLETFSIRSETSVTVSEEQRRVQCLQPSVRNLQSLCLQPSTHCVLNLRSEILSTVSSKFNLQSQTQCLQSNGRGQRRKQSSIVEGRSDAEEEGEGISEEEEQRLSSSLSSEERPHKV